MVISSLDKGMGGRVRAVIRRIIPANHAHDPLTILDAARHPLIMAEHSLWRAARWRTGIYPRRLIPITTQLALWRKIGMMISKSRCGITRLGGPGCLRLDGKMCERRAGTMNGSCRLNATIWMLNLSTEARRTELSLLGRGFLGLHLRILRRRRHPCRSSLLITNAHRLNLSFVLQQPACFPSQIPFILDPSCLRLPSASDVQPRLIAPFSAYTQKTRGAG